MKVKLNQGSQREELGLFFGTLYNAIAAATILTVTYGEWLLYLWIVLTQTVQIFVAMYLLHAKRMHDISAHTHKRHCTHKKIVY